MRCRAGTSGVAQVSRGVVQSGWKQYKRGKRWCNTTRGSRYFLREISGLVKQHVIPQQIYLASECRPSWPPSRLAIRRTHTAAMLGEGPDSTRPVTLDFFDRRRGMGHFMQLELGQFDIVDVPDLGIQLLASGRIERLFRLFQQLVGTGVLPAGAHRG